MPIFQSRAGSVSNFEAPIKNRNSGNNIKTEIKPVSGAINWSSSIEDKTQNIFAKANAAKLIDIFHAYNLDINEFNKQINCPFDFHNDSGPSFTYYHDTNSFYCFGCKIGGAAVEFVQHMENIPRLAATNKILNSFQIDEIRPLVINYEKKKESLYLEFSAMIKEFIRNHSEENDMVFIEKITKSFDTIVANHKIDDISGFEQIINNLEKLIKSYDSNK